MEIAILVIECLLEVKEYNKKYLEKKF